MALRDHPPKWTPFTRVELPPVSPEQIMETGGPGGVPISREEAEQQSARLLLEEVYLNSRYQVSVYRGIQPDDFPALIWLSVKRIDKRHFIGKDWRDLQRIKNELVGPEHEAVEIYPAESRLVDTSNQYHLWVLADPALRFPFGWSERDVIDEEHKGGRGKFRQRAMEVE